MSFFIRLGLGMLAITAFIIALTGNKMSDGDDAAQASAPTDMQLSSSPAPLASTMTGDEPEPDSLVCGSSIKIAKDGKDGTVSSAISTWLACERPTLAPADHGAEVTRLVSELQAELPSADFTKAMPGMSFNVRSVRGVIHVIVGRNTGFEQTQKGS